MDTTTSILLYFLKHEKLGRTQIMKHLYYFEYLFRKHTGKRCTDLNFIRWDYGPFEQTVYDTLSHLDGLGIVHSDYYINAYGKRAYEYGCQSDVEVSLTEVEKDVADYVIHDLSKRSFQGMIDLVYSTPPMLKILAAEEQQEHRLLGEVLPMSETNDVYKRSRASREAAKNRLATKSRERGTAEEYRDILMVEYKQHDRLRRRASSGVGRSNS